MKSLVRHLNEKLIVFSSQVDEKLVINKNFKAADANDKVIIDLINKYFKEYMHAKYEMLFSSSIKASLETTLYDNGIKNDFDKVNEFIKLNDKIQNCRITYRYVYDPASSEHEQQSINESIDEFLKDINNSGVDLKEMWSSPKKKYSVEYYECDKVILLWIGTPKFGFIYITMNEKL